MQITPINKREFVNGWREPRRFVTGIGMALHAAIIWVSPMHMWECGAGIGVLKYCRNTVFRFAQDHGVNPGDSAIRQNFLRHCLYLMPAKHHQDVRIQPAKNFQAVPVGWREQIQTDPPRFQVIDNLNDF